MIQPLPVSAFTDNYIWLVPISGAPDHVAIVDPGEARPVFEALHALQLHPAAILITHHHFDHCGGVPDLIARHRVPVFGPARSPAPGIDHPLRDGDEVPLSASLILRVFAIPGHTLDHIAYVGPDILLCGDTLFTGGCGRLFEGSAAQMLASLTRLAALPGSTRVYCGHEYTLSNLEFAHRLEPGNAAIDERMRQARRLRDDQRPTVPSTVEEERRTNPFLRCAEPGIIAAAEHAAGRTLRTEEEVFAVIRRLKDDF